MRLRIREERRAQNLTMDDLARALGCSKATIQRYEVGSAPLTLTTLAAIAAFLDVPVYCLWVDDNPDHTTMRVPKRLMFVLEEKVAQG